MLATAMLCCASLPAQGPPLAMKHGVYVEKDMGCKDAPFAAMKMWNGIGWSGAHSSQCTTKVEARQGAEYRLSTTCAAQGDGTPDTTGYVDRMTMLRVSATSFTVKNADGSSTGFRWCSAK